MMVRSIVLIGVAAAALGGCTQGMAPPSKMLAPSPRLMAPPAAPPEIKVGSDLVIEHLKLRKQYHAETSRLRSLQGYVKTARRTPP